MPIHTPETPDRPVFVHVAEMTVRELYSDSGQKDEAGRRLTVLDVMRSTEAERWGSDSQGLIVNMNGRLPRGSALHNSAHTRARSTTATTSERAAYHQDYRVVVEARRNPAKDWIHWRAKKEA